MALALPLTARATSTNVQSQICSQFEPPQITEPADGVTTKDTTIMVKGTGEPNLTVQILRNGETAAAGTIAADGTFGLSVPITQGDNMLLARETNDCSTVKDSAAVTVRGESSGQPPSGTPIEPPNVPGAELPSAGGLEQPIATVTPPNTRGFPKPVIDSPQSGAIVHVAHAVVNGRAYPGSLVTIYVNGISVAQAVSSPDGTFAARVGLDEGKNILQAQAQLGKKIATSDIREVTYIPPAKTAGAKKPSGTTDRVILTLTAVIVSGVALVWIGGWLAQVFNIKIKFRWWK